MFTLKSAGREILAYVSLKPKEQTEYFKAAREITDAQFCLANRLKRFVATILLMLAEKKGAAAATPGVMFPSMSGGLRHCLAPITTVVAHLAQSKEVSRRTSQGTVQEAYALIREDIDKANLQQSDLVAQAIHLLMESARVGSKQNSPGALVGAISQLD